MSFDDYLSNFGPESLLRQESDLLQVNSNTIIPDFITSPYYSYASKLYSTSVMLPNQPKSKSVCAIEWMPSTAYISPQEIENKNQNNSIDFPFSRTASNVSESSSKEFICSREVNVHPFSPSMNSITSSSGSSSYEHLHSNPIYWKSNNLSESHFENRTVKSKFPCPFPGCKRLFTRKDNIKYHMRTHDSNRPRPFECKICSKSYFRAIDLARHTSVTHDNVRPFECSLCHRQYTRKEALRRHERSVHNIP